jgi:hypothetical protein
MQKRFSTLVGIVVLLAMAFGVTAALPTGAAAQTGNCQWSFGADPESSTDDAIAANGDLSQGDCDSILGQFESGQVIIQGETLLVDQSGAGGAFGLPQTACQVSVGGGYVVLQGNCYVEPEPVTPVPTEPTVTPVPTEPTVTPGTETPVPGTETPVPGTETPVPGTETPAPGTETPGATKTPTTPGGKANPDKEDVKALPSTGSGSDGGSGTGALLAFSAIGLAMMAGALTVRRHSVN